MSESVQSPTTSAEQQPALRRVMGSKLLLFFVVGDILGTGIYALTGKVAGKTGGAAWLAFGVAFVVALFTATSYAELVGKYPRAAGAALYTHRAWGVPFLTFIVAFTVMASGLTSAGSGARTFGGDYLEQFVSLPTWLVAIVFLLVMAAVNFYGVSESVKLNVILTCIEVSGLVIVILLGFAGFFEGKGDIGKAVEFNTDQGNVFGLVVGGAALAFFALVGFEDSVNMVEEVQNPRKTFPRALFTGLTVCGVIYMLVAFFATTLVPMGTLGSSTAPLLEVVRAAASWFPLKLFSIIALFAVMNTALINLMMASRLVYGMAEERIIPRFFGLVHSGRRTPWVGIVFTTAIVVVLVLTADLATLGATTSLLLLAVFTLVNVAVLVLRRQKVEHEHFRAPTALPVLGAICSILLVTPWLSGRGAKEYLIAGILLLIGVALWVVNWWTHGRRTQEFDVTKLEG